MRWLPALALVALAPKCVLCLGAYLGLGAFLGLTGPELCGASPGTGPSGRTLAIGVAMSLALWAWRIRRRGRARESGGARED